MNYNFDYYISNDIKNEIINYLNPQKLTKNHLLSCFNDIKNISIVNKNWYNICKPKLKNLKLIYYLMNKYSIYNKLYENPQTEILYVQEDFREKYINTGPPQLYDALLTGCNLPFARSSFGEYNEEIENDIKLILKLIPNSLNFCLGELRCRDYVNPLCAACININIPIHIIELILEKGANVNGRISLNGGSILIIKDLKNLSEKRYKIILELFKKYGYN